MAKTKSEIIEQLVVLGYDATELDAKTKSELDALLKTGKPVNRENEGEPEEPQEVNQENISKPEAEPMVNQENEVNLTEESEKEDVICEELENVIYEETVKLRVHDTRVISLHPLTKSVIVENLGGGDAYVSGDVLRLSVHNVLKPGDKRLITDTRAILVRASSRPTLKITQCK